MLGEGFESVLAALGLNIYFLGDNNVIFIC